MISLCALSFLIWENDSNNSTSLSCGDISHKRVSKGKMLRTVPGAYKDSAEADGYYHSHALILPVLSLAQNTHQRIPIKALSILEGHAVCLPSIPFLGDLPLPPSRSDTTVSVWLGGAGWPYSPAAKVRSVHEA